MARSMAVIAACAAMLVGTLPAAAQQAAGATWQVELSGTRKVTLSAADLEHLLGARRSEMRLTVKGAERVYSGYPLEWIAAIVDDPEESVGSFFNRTLWEQGYEITVTGRDGYAATLATAELDLAAVLLADREGGKPATPSIVGSIDKGLWVKDVASIELRLPLAPAVDAVSAASEEGTSAVPAAPGGAPEFSLVLDLNGISHSFALTELEASPFFVEAPGSFTTSAGTTYTGRYGGVLLEPLIGQYVTLKLTDTVDFVATDGYRMSYAGADILDESNGRWILAFRLDGAYLPEDPGYVRTIKVGPGTPNIEGHLSVKMVARVELRQQGYRSFELVVEGAMRSSVDRQSLQSCLNCHGVTVSYERKGQAASYRGVALWRLLAYGDDPERAPHRGPSTVISYDAAAASRGYPVELDAADGFSLTLDSRALDGNDGIILAIQKDGGELPDGEWPIVLAWDKAASVPEGIKPVRQLIKLVLKTGAR